MTENNTNNLDRRDVAGESGEIYVCVGFVCGWCGIRHRTLRAAERCCAAHQRGCQAAGGYSDRYVYRDEDLPHRMDGDPYWSSHAETVGGWGEEEEVD